YVFQSDGKRYKAIYLKEDYPKGWPPPANVHLEDMLEFSQADHALVTLLERATEKLWNVKDPEKRKILKGYIAVQVNLFRLGYCKKEDLLPYTESILKSFQGKNPRSKVDLRDDEKRILYDKEFLRVDEVAKLFGVKARQVFRWVEHGKLCKD